jgi:hypothetical protein
MANTKITSLNDIASKPAATDVFPIVDVSDTTQASSGTTKKITADRFVFQTNGTVSDSLTFTQSTYITGGSVIVGNSTPRQKFEVIGVNGTPSTTGTVPTSGVARFGGAFNNVLDIGAYNTSPFAAWIQVYDRTNMGSRYSLALQPSGGSVAIGGTAPASLLDVNGTAQIDGLRIDQTPTSGAVTSTHFFTINLNGTTYRIPCGTA